MDELRLRRKWTLRAHGRQVVFVKKPVESTEHVVMKALIWALYLPQYPDLIVEIPVGDKYKPDVVSLDAQGEPVFWGEAGDVSTARRYVRSRGGTRPRTSRSPSGPRASIRSRQLSKARWMG